MLNTKKKNLSWGVTGFTLIELLIVIAIIAILALIAVPNFLEAQTRAKVTRCYSDMRTIAVAFAAYHSDNGAFPPDWDSSGNPNPVNMGQDEGKTYANLTTPIAYLTAIPTDTFYEKSALLTTYKKTAYFQYSAATWGPPSPAWAAVGALYCMSTVGPDQKDDALWSYSYTLPEGVRRAYDVTNGTVSGGDIARSNIGFIPN